MNVQILKLITGEEVLGEIESQSETQTVLCNPVGVAVVRGQNGQPSVGFAPFPLHAAEQKDRTIAFENKHIVYSYVPAEDFVKNYNQIFGAGIILPPEKQLITG
jgi:hypothetical protein